MSSDDEKKIDNVEDTLADFTDQKKTSEQLSLDEQSSPGKLDDVTSDSELYETEAEAPENIEADDNSDIIELHFSEGLPEDVLLSRMESLIFVYPEPITVRRLARLLSINGKRVRELLDKLQDHYTGRGITLVEIGGGLQFQTHAANADVVKAAIKVRPLRLSRAALETLAIVAYRQPITRVIIEDIRRVDCGGTLKFLFEKNLVKVLGRKEEPGRPIIYGTSSTFLELFGLKSLNDLPSLHEFSELWDEHQDLIQDQEFPSPKMLTPEEAIKKAAELTEKARLEQSHKIDDDLQTNKETEDPEVP